MNLADLPPCTVVASATHFEIELLKQPTVEVAFSSSEEEAIYERADAELASKIQEVAEAACGSRNAEDLVHTNWDWYPTKSRSVELDEQVFSPALVQQLIQLLEGTYADWRIYLNVYKSLTRNSQDFGVACLSKSRIIIQQSLYERLSASA
ncbi:hypothetical protein DZC73_29295 [Albitalea terrae]|uniref:Uncharacterized protein n=1 Tax=Piscinibacter terrae TaxID=2496871 RepID=A0A3N7HGN0_9BURK|nr:hypothetical protein DZC73_29295 [Albitalea terrae]